jgi:3-oxoadipate enol-lactonase
MPIANLEHVSLNYELGGLESDRPIVFVNSLGSDLHMWDKVVPFFESDVRTIRFDTRGHGLSGVPERPYTIDKLGGDLLGLLDHIGIESFTLCGLSLGGLIGQWIGVHATERVNALILANSAARFLTRDAWESRIAAVEAEGMAALAATAPSRWFTPTYIAEHPEEIHYISGMIEMTPAKGYIGCCEVLRDTDFTELLPGIQLPCLVIGGTHDPATPPTVCRMLHEGIRGSNYVELDASHLSAWEKPAEFAAAVIEFVG